MIVCHSKESLGRFDARYDIGAIHSSLSAAYIRVCANVKQQQLLARIIRERFQSKYGRAQTLQASIPSGKTINTSKRLVLNYNSYIFLLMVMSKVG